MSSEVHAPAIERQRKVRSDALENRGRVLAAARAVFAEAGLEALIPDIAARAGVGKGTVYRHFPSKEALIEALIEDYWRHFDELQDRALASDDPWVGFTTLLQGMFAIKDEQRVVVDLIAAKPDRSRAGVHARLNEALVTLFRRAQLAGSARRDIPAESLPLVLRSISAAYKAGRDLQIEWLPYLQVVLDGLRAAQPRAPLQALGRGEE